MVVMGRRLRYLGLRKGDKINEGRKEFNVLTLF
jgi:hypothetical protein